MSDVCKEYYNTTLPYLHSDIEEQYRYVYLILSILFYSFVAGGFLLFLLLKNSFVFTKQKNVFSILVFSMGVAFHVTMYIYREYVGRDKISCLSLVWIFHLPMLMVGTQTTASIYFYIYKLRQERMKTMMIKKIFKDDDNMEVQSQNSNDAGSSPTYLTSQFSMFSSKQMTMMMSGKHGNHGSMSLIALALDFVSVWKYTKDGVIVVGIKNADNDIKEQNHRPTVSEVNHDKVIVDLPLANTANATGSQPYQLPTETNSSRESDKKSLKGFLFEEIGIPFFLMLFFGWSYLIAIGIRVELDPVYKYNCYGCTLSYIDYSIALGFGVVYAPMAMVGVYAMRNESDPLRVIREIKVVLLWGVALVTPWVLNLISSLNGVNDRAIYNTVSMIALLGVFYSYVLSGIIIGIAQQKKWNCLCLCNYSRGRGNDKVDVMDNDDANQDQHRQDIKPAAFASNTNVNQYSLKHLPPPSAVDLNLVLNEPKVRSAFLEHSINELSSENLVFVFKVRVWKSIWDKESIEKVTKIAIQLYKEYISKDSKAPINIPSKLYYQVEQAFHPYVGGKDNSSNNPSSLTQTAIDELGNNNEENNNGNERRRVKSGFISKPRKDIFDECEKECVSMLQHDALPRFVHSDIFKDQIIAGGLLNKVLKQ